MGYSFNHTKGCKITNKVLHKTFVNNINMPLIYFPRSAKTSISKGNSMTIPTPTIKTGEWLGHRCFIIGGGPSLASLNFDALKDEHTIGINKAFIHYPTNINYSMDLRFYEYIRYGKERKDEDLQIEHLWNQYKGVKVFLSSVSNYPFDKDVVAIKRLKARALSLNIEKGLYAGNNSGFGAIMLAAALGANPIYLLGYDMKIDGNKTHWHEGYIKQTPIFLSKRLKKFASTFEQFVEPLERAGIKVINLTLDSGLTCFQKDTLEHVLNVSVDEVQVKAKEKQKPVYVSFYTKNTHYEEEAKKLIHTLKKFDLDYDIASIEDTGNWQRNVKYKPTLICDMLNKYAPRPIVYIDCDCVFCKYPTLFDELQADFALHKVDWSKYGRQKDAEILAGTIFVSNTYKARNIIDSWIRQCASQPMYIWDQKILHKIIGDTFFNLPAEYCTIFDSMKQIDDPVILHYQASRKYKKQKLRKLG